MSDVVIEAVRELESSVVAVSSLCYVLPCFFFFMMDYLLIETISI